MAELTIINAFDGKQYRAGDLFPVPEFNIPARLLEVKDRFFSAEALIHIPGEMIPRWSPLTVRFTHPSYFLKRVAFINT